LAIQLDNQLFLHGQVDLLTRRQLRDTAREGAAVERQPLRNAAALHFFHRVGNRRILAAALANADDVAGTHLVGRNVDLLAVDGEVAVAHELARLRPRRREAEPVDDVVEPPLELLQEQFAGDALPPIGFLEVAAELVLQHAVGALDLLLLSQLNAVTHHLRLAGATVLSGRDVVLLNRALVRVAALALQEQLHAFAPAQAANGTDVSSHLILCHSSKLRTSNLKLQTLVAGFAGIFVSSLKFRRSAYTRLRFGGLHP